MPSASPFADSIARIPVREHTVEVLGSRTAWWEYGDPDATTTIVLVHGFRGDHHGLELMVAALGGGIRAIVPDLPGFGASEPLRDRSHDIPGYAEWLIEVIEAVGAGEATVLGHSFGSIIVAAAAAGGLHADRIVLVNPIAAPALEGPKGVLSRLAVLYYRLGATLPERLGFALLRNRVIVRVMSIAMATARDRALRRWIHEQHDQYFSAFADRRVVLAAFRASVSNDVSDFAPSVPQPVLLIAAEHDQITRVAEQHRLRDRFADARLTVVPRVGHLIHYEAPDAAANAIAGFLREVTD